MYLLALVFGCQPVQATNELMELESESAWNLMVFGMVLSEKKIGGLYLTTIWAVAFSRSLPDSSLFPFDNKLCKSEPSSWDMNGVGDGLGFVHCIVTLLPVVSILHK